MNPNMGTIDQVARAFLGLALIAYVANDGLLTPAAVLAILTGVYLLATGFFSYCPVYRALGLSTFGRLDRSV